MLFCKDPPSSAIRPVPMMADIRVSRSIATTKLVHLIMKYRNGQSLDDIKSHIAYMKKMNYTWEMFNEYWPDNNINDVFTCIPAEVIKLIKEEFGRDYYTKISKSLVLHSLKVPSIKKLISVIDRMKEEGVSMLDLVHFGGFDAKAFGLNKSIDREYKKLIRELCL